jgi:fatty acid desaturase/nitrite reductase/ring-hydroxylating ferredoxin subunit
MVTPARDYSLTGPESQRAIEVGLADADWYRSPIGFAELAELTGRTDLRAAVDALLWCGLLVASGVWAWSAIGSWWAVPAFVVYGALYGGAADARWHECGHGTAFRSGWLNELVYYPASFMLLREPTVWRWSHVRHHSDTIIVGRDAEIVFPRPLNLWTWALNLVGLLGVPTQIRRILRHARGRLDADVAGYVPVELHRRVVWEARGFALVIVAVLAGCVAAATAIPLLFVLGPTFYGAWLMSFFGTTQHAGLAEDVLDHRRNTRTVYMNPVFRFLYLNMNYHVEHHMFPSVPYRNLPALHERIRDDLPPATPSTWAAYREILTAARGQADDPAFQLDRVIPDAGEIATDIIHATADAEGWVRVCGAAELAPGSMREVEFDGVPYVVCRSESGTLAALDGVCTHSRRVRLAEGTVVGDELECAKHNGRFSLADGSPTRRPVTEALGRHTVRDDDGVIRFRLADQA